MAAQVNFFCFFMFFFCLACNKAPENQHICVNKGITYLLTVLTINRVNNSTIENAGHSWPVISIRF